MPQDDIHTERLYVPVTLAELRRARRLARAAGIPVDTYVRSLLRAQEDPGLLDILATAAESAPGS